MKHLTLLLIALCAMLFTNCKTKSKATSTSEASSGKNVANAGTKVKCRLAISFTSIGSGINGAKYDEVKGYIDKHPKKLTYEEIPMGREGERDICLSLKEMNSSEQSEFIKEIKKMAEGADRVQINENAERTKP
jgi:hypothetical protein